jgi:predicted nucleotidyltransferase
MDRDAIIATLRSRKAELKALGAVGLWLFGSTARGEASARSDIDLAVTFDPATTPCSLLELQRWMARVGAQQLEALVRHALPHLGKRIVTLPETRRREMPHSSRPLP